MRPRPAGRSGIVALLFAVAFVVGIGLAPAEAATLYRRELYFTAGYERQVDSRTCVAASSAMMLNLIARRDLGLNQLTILRWAQPRDALNDSVQRGTDPLGWARAMTHFSTTAGKGAFAYQWEAYTTEYAALKRAAKLIAVTGKPVGLLVRNGTHAAVMTGFESTRDPRRGDFSVINVWVSDPLYVRRAKYATADSPLNRYLELDATKYYDGQWYRKYVIVAPVP
jgi:hypothetical protein